MDLIRANIGFDERNYWRKVGISPNIFLMNLKKQLDLFLKTSGMPATELARRSGVSRKTLQNWMVGQTPRDFDQVKAVCDVIGCNLDTLIYGEGFQKNSDQKIFDEGTWLSGVFEVKVRRIK